MLTPVAISPIARLTVLIIILSEPACFKDILPLLIVVKSAASIMTALSSDKGKIKKGGNPTGDRLKSLYDAKAIPPDAQIDKMKTVKTAIPIRLHLCEELLAR